MNEPKRRGRPPKAKPCEECGQVGSHYDDCSVGMGVLKAQALADVEAKSKEPAVSADGKWVNVHSRSDIHDIARAYAMRVWNGQAPQVPRAERIRRVKVALEGQNLPFEGVTLP